LVLDGYFQDLGFKLVLDLSQNIHHSSGSSGQPWAEPFIQINKKGYVKKNFLQFFLK